LKCQDAQKLLHAYADGELDLVTSLEVEEHFNECSQCAQAHQSIQKLRLYITERLMYFEPPARLQTRLRAAIGAKEVGSQRRSTHWRWMAIAASLAFVALAVASLIRFIPSRTTAPLLLADELLASHVRSQMLSSHLVDVKSSDQHTVKPWFKGKLDFSPEVIDLADQGFTLVGGRVDYVGHRPVAAVVYQRRKHVINLFIWPSQDSRSTPSVLTQQGFHLLSWTHDGMAYWAVSDLNEDELKEFAGLIQR
jgi:anti-sigma factor RsiW